MPADVRAQLLEATDRQHSCADAVDVVVPVHADPGSVRDRLVEELARFFDISEQPWIVAREPAGEKRPCRGGVAVAAPDQHTRRDLGNAELGGEATSLVRVAGSEHPVHLSFTLGTGSDSARTGRGYPPDVEEDYRSGDDYEVEYPRRGTPSAADFEERVVAAAVKLGLVERNEFDGDETADLVELTANGHLKEPRSALGHYVVRHWERISSSGTSRSSTGYASSSFAARGSTTG